MVSFDFRAVRNLLIRMLKWIWHLRVNKNKYMSHSNKIKHLYLNRNTVKNCSRLSWKTECLFTDLMTLTMHTNITWTCHQPDVCNNRVIDWIMDSEAVCTVCSSFHDTLNATSSQEWHLRSSISKREQNYRNYHVKCFIFCFKWTSFRKPNSLFSSSTIMLHS